MIEGITSVNRYVPSLAIESIYINECRQ